MRIDERLIDHLWLWLWGTHFGGWYDRGKPLSLIQCMSLLEVESSVFKYESMYIYHVLLYTNGNDNVMYEMTDECLNCGILVKI